MHGVPYRRASLGRERCEAGDLARHRHRDGYMTLVLSGGYAEAGDAGRFRVEAGDVLVHRPFEAHRDDFGGRAADLINLPLAAGLPDGPALCIDDVDAVVRLAESDLAAAARLVGERARLRGGDWDWPDRLAASLRRNGAIVIGDWSRRHGLDPATVSRGFLQAYGTTPRRYRAEARARSALRCLAEDAVPLAALALDLGFADQAHMTRAVVSLSGAPPGFWRGQMGSRPCVAAKVIRPA